MNENQAKHLANSARIIGMAQFAAFGYPALVNEGMIAALPVGITYLLFEALAVLVLQKND